MFHLKNLISFKYLFIIDPLPLSRSDKLFMLLGVIAIVLSIVMKIAAVSSANPIDKKYRGNLFDLLLTVGIWELVWFACRYEYIRFFGSHFVALLGLLIGFVWFVMLAAKMIKNYRKEKTVWEKEQVKLKYLPK